MVKGSPWPRRFAVAALTASGLGGLAWWVLLAVSPASRAWFKARDSADSTLLAFAAADLLLFVGAALLAAYGLAIYGSRTGRGVPRWVWTVLCLHTGAAVYAALYCVLLAIFDPHAWLGGVMMAPSLVVPPLITWWFRPRESGAHD